jgi:hypothetical protein
MCRGILILAFLSLLSIEACAKSRSHGSPSGREVVQVSADSAENRLISHPTYTMFVGVSRSINSPSSGTFCPATNCSAQWKENIVATVFWAGELPQGDDPANLASAWDANWIQTSKSQNPFYVALPYNDIQNGHTKPEASQVIPWFNQVFTRDGESVLKGRWIAVRHGKRVCYAQWEDVGPFQVDHWQYVFGPERPRPNRNHDAGIDVSPAVRDYLGMTGMSACDWKFVAEREIPPGPWIVRESPLLSARLYQR